MILLVAFGKRGYGLMAHNLAFSIKHHSPDLKIGLWIDKNLHAQLPDKSLFDDIRILEEHDYRDDKGNVDPAIAKTQIYRLGCEMSDKFMYLDVDGLCLNDLRPTLKRLEGLQIATEVIAKGGRKDKIEYSIWASNEDIWNFFELPEDAQLCAIQSSWAYFERSPVGDKMQEWLDYFMAVGMPKYMVSNQWGGTLPDELMYQGVYAKLGIEPKFEEKVLFFGNETKTTEQEVLERYKILSLYGNGGQTTRTLTKQQWLLLHDKKLREYGARPLYKAREVMADKHANSR
jgi:hypothetical protein